MILLQARVNNGRIELVDDRSGQVYAALIPNGGVTVDGVTVATTVLVTDDATLAGDGSVGDPLAIKDGGVSLTQLASDVTALLDVVSDVPTTDQHDSETIWLDSGVLKVSSAPVPGP